MAYKYVNWCSTATMAKTSIDEFFQEIAWLLIVFLGYVSSVSSIWVHTKWQLLKRSRQLYIQLFPCIVTPRQAWKSIHFGSIILPPRNAYNTYTLWTLYITYHNKIYSTKDWKKKYRTICRSVDPLDTNFKILLSSWRLYIDIPLTLNSTYKRSTIYTVQSLDYQHINISIPLSSWTIYTDSYNTMILFIFRNSTKQCVQRGAPNFGETALHTSTYSWDTNLVLKVWCASLHGYLFQINPVLQA